MPTKILRKKKHKRSSKQIQKELEAMYADDGKMPDLTHLEKRESSQTTRFLFRLILILLVLSGAAWGGFFLWTQSIFQTSDFLEATVVIDEGVRMGEEMEVRISYENISQVDIQNLELTTNLPSSFFLTSTTPAATYGTTWELGKLTASSDGSIIVKGILFSEIPSSEHFQALFTIQPANSSADLQAIATKTLELSESVLDLALTGPETALAGEEMTYTLAVNNTGKTALGFALVQLELPEGFEFISSVPERDDEDVYKWMLYSLEPGVPQQVTFTGVFTSSAEGDQELSSSIAFYQDDEAAIQSTSNLLTKVVGGSIGFHFIVNGSAENQFVDLGDVLHTSIDFENTGINAVENIEFALTLEDADETRLPINWDQAFLSEGSRENATIYWNETSDETLAAIESGAKGVIDFTFPLYNELDLSNYSDTFTCKLAITYTTTGDTIVTRTIESNPLVIGINSDAHLFAEPRYYDNDGNEIGDGILPPSVGETTSFYVLWDLENNLHDLSNVKVTTILPSDVAWMDKVSTDIGTMSFDQTTRQVTWAITSLPTDTGDVAGLFKVAITPKQEEVGTYVKLTNTVNFTAKDTATEDVLTQTINFVNTNLTSDPHALESGLVAD
jgi:uncharacterized repeat protein (TIGR01451 family)